MESIEYIGFLAGIFVVTSLFPQIIKSWKSRSTRDLSLTWTLINLCGQALWIAYGVGIGSHSLMIMSSIGFVTVSLLIGLKLRFG